MEMRIVTYCKGKCDYYVQPTATNFTAGYTTKREPYNGEKNAILLDFF